LSTEFVSAPVMSWGSTRLLATAFTLAIALLPVLLMTTDGGGSVAFHLIFLLSIALLLRAPMEVTGNWTHRHRWLPAGMAMLLVAVLASLAVHGLWKGSEVEKALRLLCSMLVLAAALRVPRALLARALLGVMPAVWCAAAIIGWLVLVTDGRPETPQFNSVTYGNLTLLLSVICLFSMGMDLTPFPGAERALKLLTGLLGVVAFLWTQTRGGLLAVPCFLLIGLVVTGPRLRWMRAVAGALLVVATMAAATHDGALKGRIAAGISEYDDCSAGHLADTSVCIRLQLWRSALHMIREAPVFGVGGGDRFREELASLAEAGAISPFVARDFGEAHNDFLHFTATFGVLGGLGLVLAYLSPAVLLAQRLRRGPQTSRLAAAAGLSLCSAFAIFGLTEMMMRDMRVAAFYAVWVALLLALSWPGAPAQPAARAAL